MNEAKQPDFQFYPTPRSLAIRMWEKFQNREVTRCLEPSCGSADLLMGYEGVAVDRGHLVSTL